MPNTALLANDIVIVVNTVNTIKYVLLIVASIGILLLGMKLMSDNLESAAGGKMNVLLDRIGDNRFAGLGIGATVTAVIQSSAATTVMVIGLLNAGIMTLFQATTIILGANIGTTVTGLLASLSALKIVPVALASVACVGAFMMMFCKKHILVNIGGIVMGFGLIFCGLTLASEALTYIKQLPAILDFFASIQHPLLLILVGIVFTAAIQSSSASISIVIVLAGSGIMPLENAVFVVLGANVGTCMTVILAAIGANANAKRAAAIHLFAKLVGVIFFMLILFIFPNVLNLLDVFEKVEFQIAIFHSVFNIVTAFLLIGFTKHIVKLFNKLIKDTESDKQEAVLKGFVYLDTRLMSAPTFAMPQLRKEVLNMARLAKTNLDISIDAVITSDVSIKPDFVTREKNINFLNRELTKFLVEISSAEISFRDEKIIGSLYHVITDIERIGDYAENIIEYTEEAIADKSSFSDTANNEIKDMQKLIDAQFDLVLSAFENETLKDFGTIKINEEEIDTLQEALQHKHIERMNKGLCSASSSSRFLSLISNLERIADHIENIAITLKDYC